MSIVYDAGVLVAADRSDRGVWADHRIRLEAGLIPVTTAPVLAQVSRSPRQAQLHRFVRGCQVVSFSANSAAEVGALLAKAAMSDVVDAHVVTTAAHRSSLVLTSDPDDLGRLVSALPTPITVAPL